MARTPVLALHNPTHSRKQTMNREFPFLNRPMGLPISAIEAMAKHRPEFQQILAIAKDAKSVLQQRTVLVRQMQIADLIKRR